VAGLSFEVISENGDSRIGTVKTFHGQFLTPVFMPVGTQATVKSVLPSDVW